MSFESSLEMFKYFEHTQLTFDTCVNFFDSTMNTDNDNSPERQIMCYVIMFVNFQTSLMDGITWLVPNCYVKIVLIFCIAIERLFK